MKGFQRCFNLKKMSSLNNHIKQENALGTGCAKHTFIKLQ